MDVGLLDEQRGRGRRDMKGRDPRGQRYTTSVRTSRMGDQTDSFLVVSLECLLEMAHDRGANASPKHLLQLMHNALVIRIRGLSGKGKVLVEFGATPGNELFKGARHTPR